MICAKKKPVLNTPFQTESKNFRHPPPPGFGETSALHELTRIQFVKISEIRVKVPFTGRALLPRSPLLKGGTAATALPYSRGKLLILEVGTARCAVRSSQRDDPVLAARAKEFGTPGHVR
jgi:hypothetical protein